MDTLLEKCKLVSSFLKSSMNTHTHTVHLAWSCLSLSLSLGITEQSMVPFLRVDDATTGPLTTSFQTNCPHCRGQGDPYLSCPSVHSRDRYQGGLVGRETSRPPTTSQSMMLFMEGSQVKPIKFTVSSSEPQTDALLRVGQPHSPRKTWVMLNHDNMVAKEP